MGLDSGMTSASGVYWYQKTGVMSSVLYRTWPSKGASTICGRLMPTMFEPSSGREFSCAHIRPPPAPGLYWMMVSMAGHFFFRTSCWCRAAMSDSPPTGKACQYNRFFSGQVWASAAGAKIRTRIAISLLMAGSPFHVNGRRVHA